MRGERNNYYRLQRALAVVAMTGAKLAELDAPGKRKQQQGQQVQHGQNERGRGGGAGASGGAAGGGAGTQQGASSASCQRGQLRQGAVSTADAGGEDQEGRGRQAAGQPQGTLENGHGCEEEGVGEPLGDDAAAGTSGSTPGCGGEGEESDGGYDWRLFFLHRPRTHLYDRIDGRVEEMAVGGALLLFPSIVIYKGML